MPARSMSSIRREHEAAMAQEAKARAVAALADELGRHLGAARITLEAEMWSEASAHLELAAKAARALHESGATP